MVAGIRSSLSMADVDGMIAEMKEALCPEVSAEEVGKDTYRIHTGYFFQDGDELYIVLRRGENGWVLTDNGHTVMWLSYEDFELTESQMSALTRTPPCSYARHDGGCIWVPIGETDAGGAIRSIVQVILGAADLLYLNRRNARIMPS